MKQYVRWRKCIILVLGGKGDYRWSRNHKWGIFFGGSSSCYFCYCFPTDKHVECSFHAQKQQFSTDKLYYAVNILHICIHIHLPIAQCISWIMTLKIHGALEGFTYFYFWSKFGSIIWYFMYTYFFSFWDNWVSPTFLSTPRNNNIF